MSLKYLEFDLSEDTDGLGTWDALASPAAQHTHALLAEVLALTQELTRMLGPAGPIEEGHLWDLDLQIQDESGQALPLQLDASYCGRLTLALSLTGGAELAQCLN